MAFKLRPELLEQLRPSCIITVLLQVRLEHRDELNQFDLRVKLALVLQKA